MGVRILDFKGFCFLGGILEGGGGRKCFIRKFGGFD